MGLNMREKQAVTREYKPRYKQASKKEKKALLDDFIKLAGYHRKSAIRLLCAKQMKQAIIYQRGKAVKINNLALKDEVCCLGKVFDSGFNTQNNALKGGGIKPIANNKTSEKKTCKPKG